MIRSVRRLGVTLLSVALLFSGALAQLAVNAEPAAALLTAAVVTTSSDLTTVAGESVTFTVTVTGTTTIPTGTINLVDGATAVCSTQALAPTTGLSAAGTCTTTALSVATHVITGEYNGNPTYDPNTSAPISQIVSKASTATTDAGAPNPAAFGAAVTFTANVASVLPGTGTPTGTVAFQDNAVNITGCATQALTAHIATCTTSALGVGTHPITAVYSGDANFTTSTSSAGSQVVNAIVTTTTISGVPNPSVFSGSVTLTSTVSSGSGTPTGNVAFKLGGTNITGCATQALTAGTATCVVTTLPVAANAITAAVRGRRQLRGEQLRQPDAEHEQGRDHERSQLERPDHQPRRPGHVHGHHRCGVSGHCDPVHRDRELQREWRCDRDLWRQGADQWRGDLHHHLRARRHHADHRGLQW